MSNTNWRMVDCGHQLAIMQGDRTLLYTQWKYAGPSEEERVAAQLAAAAPDLLAAAAPDLLAALQRLLELRPDRMGFENGDDAKRFFEAVGKAELAVGKAIVSPQSVEPCQ